MDFDAAITGHIRWKVRLARFIDGAGESIAVDAAARDDLCGLGRWIYGEGARFQSWPHYHELVRKNAAFHLCAADIVRKVTLGARLTARGVMRGPIATASKETIAAVMDLRRAVEKHGRPPIPPAPSRPNWGESRIPAQG